MNIEHKEVVIPLDEKYEEATAALKADGWIIVPGKVPQATFHLMRVHEAGQPLSAGAGMGRMIIDESKIQLVRNGKVVG